MKTDVGGTLSPAWQAPSNNKWSYEIKFRYNLNIVLSNYSELPGTAR
jgi:hypothetical protein